jgi:hypothetical protein
VPDPKRNYSEEEVRGILDRALRHETSRGISHEELVAAASEVGISPDALDAAIRESEGRRAEAELREGILERRRRGFRGHLTSYLAVNAVLTGINALVIVLSGVFVPWALFVILGWGLGLFFHWRAASSGEVSERELARERERFDKQRRKLEKERRKEADEAERRARRAKIEKNATELGKVVEEGVGELLGALADELGKGGEKRAAKPKGSKKRRKEASRYRVEVDDDEARRDRAVLEDAEAEADEEADAERRRRRR